MRLACRGVGSGISLAVCEQLTLTLINFCRTAIEPIYEICLKQELVNQGSNALYGLTKFSILARFSSTQITRSLTD